MKIHRICSYELKVTFKFSETWLLFLYKPCRIQVVVSVAHSDFKQTGSDISRAALIEFVLLEAAENCSLTDECDFETGLCGWELEQNVQNIRSEDSPVDSLQDNTGIVSNTHLIHLR